MEKYLNYLLADIAGETANVPVPTFEDSEEGPSFIPLEEEEKMARREILGEWIGLRQELFPPASRLNDEQIGRLLESLILCLDAYNFIPHFPAGLPLRKGYEVLRAQLAKEVPILVHNAWQLDFCDYEPRSCPFGEGFCQCKVYELWLSHAEQGEMLDEETMERMAEKNRLPDFFLQEEYEEAEDFFEEEEFDEDFEEGYPFEDEYDDFDDFDDNDGLFLSDFSDYEPGPDDGGRWN